LASFDTGEGFAIKIMSSEVVRSEEHKFSKSVGATSKFWEPEASNDASSIPTPYEVNNFCEVGCGKGRKAEVCLDHVKGRALVLQDVGYLMISTLYTI